MTSPLPRPLARTTKRAASERFAWPLHLLALSLGLALDVIMAVYKWPESSSC